MSFIISNLVFTEMLSCIVPYVKMLNNVSNFSTDFAQVRIVVRTVRSEGFG